MVDCIKSSVSNHSWAPKGEYPSFSLCICNSCSGDFQSSLLGSVPKLDPLTLCSCSQPLQFRQYQGLSKDTSSTSPSSGPSPIFFFHLFFFFLTILWCGPPLKSSLNSLQCCFCSTSWLFGHKAPVIPAPWPGSWLKSNSPQWKAKSQPLDH